MKIKANLHLHTSDDTEDSINYSFIDALDAAKAHGFQCIALTCHNKFVNREDYKKAAEARGILFVPGVERTIEKRHVVILNPDKDVDAVKTFVGLEAYKKAHPDIFVIAPHPYFPGGYSLQKKLGEYARLFDAIEHSWFYSTHINCNTKAKNMATKLNLPFIATSDTHNLKFLNTNYAEIEVEEKTIPALFKAIRERKFTNTTSPRKLFREMLLVTLHSFLTREKRD